MTRSDWPPASQARYTVIVLMVAYLFSYVDRQILSMLVGPIKADLGLSDTEISLLHGLAFALFYTLFGIWPIGTWADKGNRRNIIAGGVFFWSLLTAVCGRMTSFAGLFAARVGVGVGEAALTPTAYSMLADYFPPEKRGRALGLFSMGVYFGIGVAIMLTGALVQYVSVLPPFDLPLIGEIRGWQIPFYQRLWSARGIEPGDVRSLDDITKLPVYDKTDLMASVNAAPPYGDFDGRGSDPVIFHTTSGTTGVNYQHYHQQPRQ
jgi:MFS family permease